MWLIYHRDHAAARLDMGGLHVGSRHKVSIGTGFLYLQSERLTRNSSLVRLLIAPSHLSLGELDRDWLASDVNIPSLKPSRPTFRPRAILHSIRSLRPSSSISRAHPRMPNSSFFHHLFHNASLHTARSGRRSISPIFGSFSSLGVQHIAKHLEEYRQFG